MLQMPNKSFDMRIQILTEFFDTEQRFCDDVSNAVTALKALMRIAAAGNITFVHKIYIELYESLTKNIFDLSCELFKPLRQGDPNIAAEITLNAILFTINTEEFRKRASKLVKITIGYLSLLRGVNQLLQFPTVLKSITNERTILDKDLAAPIQRITRMKMLFESLAKEYKKIDIEIPASLERINKKFARTAYTTNKLILANEKTHADMSESLIYGTLTPLDDSQISSESVNVNNDSTIQLMQMEKDLQLLQSPIAEQEKNLEELKDVIERAAGYLDNEESENIIDSEYEIGHQVKVVVDGLIANIHDADQTVMDNKYISVFNNSTQPSSGHDADPSTLALTNIYSSNEQDNNLEVESLNRDIEINSPMQLQQQFNPPLVFTQEDDNLVVASEVTDIFSQQLIESGKSKYARDEEESNRKESKVLAEPVAVIAPTVFGQLQFNRRQSSTLAEKDKVASTTTGQGFVVSANKSIIRKDIAYEAEIQSVTKDPKKQNLLGRVYDSLASSKTITDVYAIYENSQIMANLRIRREHLFLRAGDCESYKHAICILADKAMALDVCNFSEWHKLSLLIIELARVYSDKKNYSYEQAKAKALTALGVSLAEVKNIKGVYDIFKQVEKSKSVLSYSSASNMFAGKTVFVDALIMISNKLTKFKFSEEYTYLIAEIYDTLKRQKSILISGENSLNDAIENLKQYQKPNSQQIISQCQS